MFLITNRQSSSGGFYFLYILFFLHLCTAFLTIINALHNDLSDNEAIIQLSVDSIHVVKSVDPRFANIEENASDNEEKELLIALLTSYDDEYKTTKTEVDIEIPLDTTFKSSSIRFIPPSLNFYEQSIAMSQMHTVTIINDESEPLEIYSLSGTTIQFYSSFFKQTILPPYGGNTSINVYFLPRTIGIIKSTFTIKTNRGNFYYYVNGIGTLNPFRLRPLIDGIIPLNTTFEYIVQFYNPYNSSIDINEIYTSDENLIIELLYYKNMKTKISKTFEHKQQWHLKPYEMKSIIKLNYFAYKIDRLHGFVCIKTNSNDTIIIPVEMNVLNHSGIYSNVDLLEFTNDRFVRSITKSITIPVYVTNNGLNPVTISDVRVIPEDKNYVFVHHKNLEIPPGTHRLNKIADLTLYPYLIPNNIQHLHGSVQLYTSSDNDEPVLQISFYATVLHGALDFVKEETYFYIPSSTNEMSNKKTEQCQSIKLINRFNTTIAIYKITADKPELLSKYVEMKTPSSFLYMNPGQWTEVLCISLLKQPLVSAPFNSFQISIDMNTNISSFNLPIHLYNGFLNVYLLSDNTNGGIRRNNTNAYEFFLTSIPVNVPRTVTFLLLNTNPIDIAIKKFSFTLPNTDIQLEYMQVSNGTQIISKILYKNNNISQLIIPAGHQAIFSLTINATYQPKVYSESINFQTRYQNLHMHMKYDMINESFELTNTIPFRIDISLTRPESVDIFVNNNFDKPTNLSHMDFMSYGTCFSFTWNNTLIDRVVLEPNKIQRIGKLNVDIVPYCNTIQTPSEPTAFCGIKHHPEFRQQWDEVILALNTYELDDKLVIKFRSLWKEWTSFIRKQQFETHIWLYTNRASISWPVIVGFVWPSVLEHMSSSLSRTPIILDFQVTLINMIKTQNVIITNPSSQLLSYSVEFLNRDLKYNNNTKSFINDQVFFIATVSKEVDLINSIYKFNLSPNEQITFSVSYHPTLSIKHEMYLIIRNNLTIMESILLRGEGGVGSLQVGNRKAGSSPVPIVLEMNEKQSKYCSVTNENLKLRKTIALRNTGKMKTIIHDVSFGNSKCSGQGFFAEFCANIEIEPNKEYNLNIQFQPDYTTDYIDEVLVLNTNIGVMTFPIIVRIPQNVLAACYQTIPRPFWELRTYCLCFCSLLIFIILIFTSAVYDAQRLFDNYLTRAEWRGRIQMTDNKIFDLSDLSMAVQDEQKTRERIESHTPITSKKEKVVEISNSDNKLKPKRSITSTNESAEKSSKAIRTSDTPVQAEATSPKAIPRKARRATTDNGQPKSSKQQHETSSVTQPLRRQKSVNTEPHISPPSQRTVSSSAISDDESEPFVVSRPRRVSAKAKESSTNIVPKSTSSTDDAIPLRPAPSPPVAVIPKPLIRSDPPEQRQQRQDLSRLDDSTNDQQWHMVNSNRGQRRATAATIILRRETNDESQTTNKPIKISSINPIENPMVKSSRPYTSVSNESPQSRRRPRRRPTRKTSVMPNPMLTKRTSLHDDTSLNVSNRELAFRQLTEQLWAAGLPSSTTACSMSIRSRCSSAPPSERGGGEDEKGKIDWDDDDDDDDDDEKEDIDWDEPDKPDEGNSNRNKLPHITA